MLISLNEGLSPKIDPSVFIGNGAVITGDVKIKKDSSIWFNAVVRGDAEKIRIGESTNIQDGSILHADKGFPLIIGNHVTAGHRAILHGCRIENKVLIGMGAIIMNGVSIGEGSIVAAGSVVLENIVIPPYSMVAGAPAVVKKRLEKNVADKIVESASHYVELKNCYLKDE